jgi:hypothetical protein
MSLQEIIDQVEQQSEVTGIWPPKIRRQLKDEGYLVIKNKTNYTVAKDYKPLIGKSRALLQTRVPNNVIKFYLDKGFIVAQEKRYKDGCGYPSDAYDICDCYRCTHGEQTFQGYLVTVTKATT